MSQSFENFVTSTKITPEEHKEFVYACSDWALFCTSLTKYDKLKVIKLMCYLVEERSSAHLFLKRAIGRFNRLNSLSKEALIAICKRRK
jgi:hypothetical protein